MEKVVVFPGSDADFDRLVHDGTLPDEGDLQIASKNNATRDGNAAVVLSFTVALDDGSLLQRVQTVTTLAALKLAVDCCVAAAERGV